MTGKTFTGTIEFTILDVSDQQALGTMTIRDGMLNPFGVVNAGAILWFADVCASVLITGKRGIVPGEAGFPLAINLSGALLGNQKSGAFRATSRYVKKGRSLSVVRTLVEGDDGRIIADVTTSHIASK